MFIRYQFFAWQSITGCPKKHDRWWIVFNVFFHDNCIRYLRFFADYFVKQIFYSNIHLFEINFTIKLLPFSISLSLSLVSHNLTNYWRRHFKLFTNCHISSDTMYLEKKKTILKMFLHHFFNSPFHLFNLIYQQIEMF